MHDQIILCGVALPAFIIGAVLWLQRRASDRRAEERHAEIVSLLARPGEVLVAPDSSRVPTITGAFATVPRDPRPVGLLPEERDQYVAFFSPDGAPRAAAECAARIDRELVADENLCTDQRSWVTRDEILYRPGPGDERMLLETVVSAHLRDVGAAATEEDVKAIAARLCRPAAVRSLPG